jgi:hypothetical protein
MDDLFGLFIFSSVFAMAIALYRVTSKALDTMRAIERRLVPLTLTDGDGGRRPIAEAQRRADPAPADPARRMETQLQQVIEHLGRLAQMQEATLQVLNERAARPRTPVQGVPATPSAH